MLTSKMPTFEELLKPLPIYSPKRWYYEGASLLLRSIGTLSRGIKTGYTHGFDSGMIMNYVYEDTPQGTFYIGKALDRVFLNQITCKAFRSIKEIQKNMIKDYLAQRNGVPTFIADLASGKADYLYDALLETNSQAKILLRDIDEEALKESEAIAQKLNLPNELRFELGSAIDTESLRKIDPEPDLVIEVGLYGIIHDDEQIRRHFLDLKEILNPEAILFNVQTYNPQIELIARSLVNRDGERCVWHLRPVELVIGWAEEAGFVEPQIVMDDCGVYAVVMMKNQER
ncbi:MAG: methyltransferase domain-containing protein [Thermodesulfobacteriales bacterium]|nr:MAG: methyltransferase domain-containing protein [Thermodesulfobacteriales bacterium]